MRFHEFNQIDEAMPNWAKKLGAAATLGVAATTGYQGLKDPGGTTKSIDQIERELDAATPKIKADSGLVQQLLGVLKTPAATHLVREARAAGMKGRELAQFLAQCAHESLNFELVKELGDEKYFRMYDIKYAPEKAKELGNVRPGDGARYAGRGYIQLTGRENYRRAGRALGLPLEEHPELVERPDVAAKVSVWFWKNRVQPRINDYSNTPAVTKPINKGLKAVEERHEKYKAFAHILGVLNWPSYKNT